MTARRLLTGTQIPLGCRCVVGLFGENPCPTPASIQVGGQWFCAGHAAVIEKQGAKKR